MREVNINKENLLKIVRENLIKHINEFNESVADYKKLVLKISNENLKLAKTANLEEFTKIRTLPYGPISYEDSYNSAIRMLELSTDTTIKLTNDEFTQLVMDEWNWKKSFTASTSLYKSLSNLVLSIGHGAGWGICVSEL